MNSDDKLDRTDHTEAAPESSAGGESCESTSQSRRRFFIKAGLAAVPVFLTLRGLPARASSSAMGSLGDYDYEGGDRDRDRDQDRDWDRDRDDRQRGRDKYDKDTSSPDSGSSNAPSRSF